MPDTQHPLPVSDLQKQLQQRMEGQKLESLGRFAGGIAHDFNNILSIIEGHTHAALKKLAEGHLTAEQLQKILLSTQRGAGLTRQLLAFSRQKIGVEETIMMQDMLARQRILLTPLLRETIRLHMTADDDPIWVTAAEDYLTQIILNLGINARDAMPHGGEVTVRCSARNADSFRLSVTDTGHGIPPRVLKHIFDPFYTTKDAGKGTGLGLSVVHGIVEQMGGKISVVSGPAGTAFHIDLPRAAVPNVVAIQSEPMASRLKGKTVLVAEDEPELRSIMAVMLSEFDMRVLEASNGNDAMLLQRDYPGQIDFLLTDVVMPEMDGLRLGKLFSVNRPDTNVIYMSGYPVIDGRMDGRAGMSLPDAADFIPKPMQEETVRQVLERALARRDARRGMEKEGAPE
jgi:CheY-like chemotaxis protein